MFWRRSKPTARIPEKRYRFFSTRYNGYVDVRANSLDEAKQKLINGSTFSTWEELKYEPWYMVHILP